VTGGAAEVFTKDASLRALDRVCYEDPSLAAVVDHTAELEERLSRQWRERRVRASLVACSLAHRREMALRWKLLERGVKPEEVAEYQQRLLEERARVERTEVRLEARARTWYLNVTEHIRDGLRGLSRADLLREGPVVPSATRA
jgi:hypothetical protein